MPTYALTIGGVSQSIKEGTLRISETANGRNQMSFEVLSLDGTYRPAIGAEVIYTEDSTRLFGGYVQAPEERGFIPGGGTRIVNGVSVADYNGLVERRVIVEVIPAGNLKAALTVLVTYLADYGVTLDAAQVNGPTLSELVYHYRPMRAVMDELTKLTGYLWEITYDKKLRMFLPGSSTAPFHVVPASDPSVVIGDIEVETSREDYANRVLLLVGDGLRDITESFVGDGSTRGWHLRVAVAGYPSVTVNGNPVTLGIYGVDTAYEWTFNRASNDVIQLPEAPTGTLHAALTSGDTLSIAYGGNHPYLIQVDDAAEQATNGLWEVVLEEPDVFDDDVAQALADAYLERRTTTFKTVQYVTSRSGILPGMTQTITVPDRNLSGTFLVTDVETNDLSHTFRRRVTAIGTTTYRGSWRDMFREWGQVRGGGSNGAVVVSDASAPQLSSPAWLGGSRNTSIAKSPAAWTPVVDYVPFTAPSSFAGRVRAQIFTRNAGVTVTARLYNETDVAVVATSSGVTSTTPTEVTFIGSLIAGKTYRLEIQSSASGEGVFGLGVLESV